MDKRKSPRMSNASTTRTSAEPNRLSRGRTSKQSKTNEPAPVPRRRSERVKSVPSDQMAIMSALFTDSSEGEIFSPSPEVKKNIIRVPAVKKNVAVKRKSSESEGKKEADADAEWEEVPSKTPEASKKLKPGRSNVKEENEAGGGGPRRSARTPKPLPKWEAPERRQETPRSARIQQKDTGSGVPTRKSARGRSRADTLRNEEITETPKSTPKSTRKVPKEADEASATPRSSRRGTATKTQVVDTAKKVNEKSSGSPTKPSTSAGKIQGTKLEWKFNVYGIPKCPLPCREDQFEEIWKFLFENISEKNSGCMYVSGVPGTGKTVIVQAVVDTMLKINAEKKKDLNFQYLYINGLTLASPDKIWKRMFKGLDIQSRSKGISTKEALKRLDSYFESHQRLPVVLVVDELDQILDKQQSILYQLLEWSSHAKHMFSFVAIFNTMSLPEHGLAMRNYSRMGFKRAVFPPYNFEQLQTIVLNMLSTFKAVRLNSESISLLSRKVAAISGDARRALEIARRAMEIAESSNSSGIQAVSNAFKEIFSSAKIETIKHTSLLEQLVLKTICDEVRCSGIDEVLTAKICDGVTPKAVYEGMQWPKDEILKALMRLAVMRLVIVEDNRASLHKRVLLKVPVEDVNFALGIQDVEA